MTITFTLDELPETVELDLDDGAGFVVLRTDAIKSVVQENSSYLTIRTHGAGWFYIKANQKAFRLMGLHYLKMADECERDAGTDADEKLQTERMQAMGNV